MVLDADLDAPGVASMLAGHGGATAPWGIVDYLLERRLMRDVQPDAVIHLAARPRVRFTVEQPLQSSTANLLGTIAVLDSLLRAELIGKTRFVPCVLLGKEITRRVASEVQNDLGAMLDLVERDGERIILDRRGKSVAALVPITDIGLLREIEGRLDNEAATEAHKKADQLP